MARLHTNIRNLIIAGFISAILITGIANLSFATSSQKAVLESDVAAPTCVMSMCSLL